jgi:disulfide bond formation protein DsbB
MTVSKNQFRLLSVLPFLFCAGLLAYALYVEHVMFLMPCNLCILQRVVFIGIGLLYLLASFKPAQGWGRKIFGVLLLLTTACGIGISGRHVWLQGLPPELVPDCGPSLQMMLDNTGIFEALSAVLSASGNCADIQWELLGMSMPTWTLFCFIGLFIYTILWMFIKIKES